MDGNIHTKAVHAGEEKAKPFHSLTNPIVLSSTFPFDNSKAIQEYMQARSENQGTEREEYARYGNPTVRTVEKKVAELEDAEGALLFSSGMNAITTTLIALLSAGDHLIFFEPLYRRSREFAGLLKKWNIDVSFIKQNDFSGLERNIRPETRVIFAETPTNPTLRVLDLERLKEITKKHSIITFIDSTFATPINFQPLHFGADLVIHSATKYLGGHNDLLAGVVAGKQSLLETIKAARDVLGGVSSPIDAYLLLRGLKTLALRIHKQNENGMLVAKFLQSHPAVNCVYYPGLEEHPDFEIASRLMSGFGGVVSFEVNGGLQSASRVVDALKIPYIGPTLGGVESIAQQPALFLAQASGERETSGIPDSLIRYALGIEDTEDLISDLKQALGSISGEGETA